MGHVRDLPKSQMGVDIEHNYEPKYITIRGKGPVLKDLKTAAKKAKKFSWQLTLIVKVRQSPGIWHIVLISISIQTAGLFLMK